MINHSRLQLLLEQSQAALEALETGNIALEPNSVPPSVAMFIHELGVNSSELQQQVAHFGFLVREGEALMERLRAVRSNLPRRS